MRGGQRGAARHAATPDGTRAWPVGGRNRDPFEASALGSPMHCGHLQPDGGGELPAIEVRSVRYPAGGEALLAACLSC